MSIFLYIFHIWQAGQEDFAVNLVNLYLKFWLIFQNKLQHFLHFTYMMTRQTKIKLAKAIFFLLFSGQA